jgi:carboxymethylenebutenolidase
MTLIGALDHRAVSSDAQAFIRFLDAQPEVNRKAKIGAVGFCMGGAMTIRAAAVRPERVGACISFTAATS